MTNKQYLKENGLYEAHKQFMRLCEWSYSSTPLEEDDEPQQQDPNAMGGAPQGGDMSPMGGDSSMGGGAPQDPNAMGGDMSMGTDPSMDGAAPQGDGMNADPSMDTSNDMPMGEDPSMDMPPMMGDDEPQEDEDVIDVEDLTQAQEKVNDKVNHIGQDLGNVDTRIEKLMSTITKLESMIDKSNQRIEDLNKELKDRVKTPTEKLNLRSLDSYPFNVKPTEYWDKVKQNPNYSISTDNAESTDGTYTIKQSDLEDLNTQDVEDSFVLDDTMRQDLNKIFGL